MAGIPYWGPDPANPGDVTPKSYVDAKIAQLQQIAAQKSRVFSGADPSTMPPQTPPLGTYGNDYYITDSTSSTPGLIYFYDVESWSLVANLKGAQGVKGDTGPANSLTIGTVSTGAVGADASATVTGTAPNQTLNLSLPRGATGNTGASNTLAIGSVSTGAAGSSASATITGTSPNQTLNLSIPQGIQGVQGNTGATLSQTATSTTSQAVATGSKTFAISGVGGTANFAVGQLVRVFNTGTPANYMQGLLTAASATSVTVNVTETGGSGTITAWTVAPAGTTGATGQTGNAGPSNTLAIGTVSTGAAGSSAAATVTGTSPNQTLNLTIPQGNVGVKGDTGNTGPVNTLAIGTVTTGAVGSSASASITGTAPNQTLNLTLPTGATGATGTAGATGPANTLAIGTVTTGAAGSNASASITGTAPNQTLSLTIPQGVAGTAGTNGSNGATYTTTSTSPTSQAVGTGSKTFTITGVNGTPNYVVNQLVRVYSTSTPQNYMQGLVTSTSTNSITINATEIGGSGTITSWTIVPSGTPGTVIYVLAPGDADPTSSSPAGFYFRRTS